MSKDGYGVGFVLGTVFGAAVGAVAGVFLAPRSGAESRALAADAMNDAWDVALDTYETGAKAVSDRVNEFRPMVDASTDELRAKVDAARERMDQMRSSLSESVAAASAQVQSAVDAAGDALGVAAEPAQAADVVIETPASDTAEKSEDAEHSDDTEEPSTKA